MASSTPPLPLSRVCSSSSFPCLSDKNHGRSTAQMCLKKILEFISTNKSLELLQSQVVVEEEEVVNRGGGRRGFDIDLNLRLGTVLESEIDDYDDDDDDENKGGGFSSACSGVGDNDDGKRGLCDVSTLEKSCLDECDPNPHLVVVEQEEEEEIVAAVVVIEAVVVIDEETKEEESSEITELQVSEIEKQDEDEDGHYQSEIKSGKQKEQVENQQESKRVRKSEGYLDLLVEAARLVSAGDFEEEDDDDDKVDGLKAKKPSPSAEETQGNTEESIRLESEGTHKKNWMVDCFGGIEEDISPIVRSKRGRNQVLPYKYRDSVLEPWNRLTKPRSATTSTSSRASRKRSK